MALTYSIKKRSSAGDKRVNVVEVTFDASYPTGGEVVGASALGLSTIDNVAVNPHASRIVTWDHANKKLKVHTALSTEAANLSDQSTITVRLVAIGD